MSKFLVFVFGTLKRGYGNHHHIRNAKFVGPAISVEDNYVMQDVGFPTLWQDYNAAWRGRVMGEVYEIDNEQLARCDRLEGNGRMYTRVERDFHIMTRGGKNIKAWVYLWNLDRDNDQIDPVDGVLIWDREQRRKIA